MFDSFRNKFILKSSNQENRMQSELDIAIDDLKYNYPIYLVKMIKRFLQAEAYEDLAIQFYTIQDRNEIKNPFHMVDIDRLKFNQLCGRMRSRKYVWGDDKESRELMKAEFITKDAKAFIQHCNSFIEESNEKYGTEARIGKTVKNLSKMFSFTPDQEIIMQFLIDCEVSIECGILDQDYSGLFSWYNSKNIFKASTYEILATFARPVKKDFDEFKGIIQYENRTPFSRTSYATELQMNPFWPKIPQIYINLICDNKEITFDNVHKKFEDNFKRKLTYADFEKYAQTPVVEKLINQSLGQNSIGTNVLFYGLPGTGKTEMVHALAQQNNWKLVVIGEQDSLTPYGRMQDLIFAQRFFANFKNEKIVFLFDEMEDVLRIEPKEMGKNQINRVIENSPFPIFWTSNNVWKFDQSFLRRMTYASKFDIPNKKRRKEIWSKFSHENNLNLDQKTIENYAQSYQTSPSVIGNVSEVASKAKLEQFETKLIIEDLLTAYNQGQQATATKDSYIGQYIPYDFELANTDTDLLEMVSKLKNTTTNAWSMCLHGAPGTGKSAFARQLADELGIKIIYKRASDLMSMWVGETEKNIARAFEEARDDEALLIFDEADSFLNSRAEARQSWQITQVNEMLTQMENSKFPFICTTNLMDNLDEASLRRFVFKVKFDWMKTEQIKLACTKFFGMEINIPKEWKLSPGDLVSVKKRTDILGTKEASEIFQLLKQEVELKRLEGTKKIGF